MPSPNAGQLLASTLSNYTSEIADAVANSTWVLSVLKQKGNWMEVDGGVDIVENLEYAENSSFMYYSGNEILNLQVNEVFDFARFSWKQAAVSVQMSGLEEVQNSGKAQIFNLATKKIKNARTTMENNIAVGVYSDGTGTGGKQITGLQAAVPDDPTTGTYGGINRATWTFWRSSRYRGVTDGGAAVSSSNIRNYMSRLYNPLTRMKETPSMIIADNNYYTLYEESLMGIQNLYVKDAEPVDGGLPVLRYKGSKVYCDGGMGGACPANHMYFLNPDYLYFKVSPKRNFEVIGGKRSAINQDATVQIVAMAGNLTCSNAKMHGVLIA